MTATDPPARGPGDPPAVRAAWLPPAIPLPDLPGRPTVSVVMPSYNQAAYLAEAVESVLSQDYRPLELIVVDGASTDGTRDILDGYAGRAGVRVLSEPDDGPADAVNKGFALATGEIVGVQSSDDGLLPGAVAEAVAALRGRPDLGLVYGDVIAVDAAGRRGERTRIAPYTLEDFLAKQTWIPQPSAFFRSALLGELGGWDGAYFVCDTEFWLRAAFRTNVMKVDRAWGVLRRHDGQRDRRGAEIAAAYERMVRESAELRSAPRRVRGAARAGVRINRIRYNGHGSALRASGDLWAALAARPELFAAYRDSPLLVPGWLPTVSFLHRTRARLFRRSGNTP